MESGKESKELQWAKLPEGVTSSLHDDFLVIDAEFKTKLSLGQCILDFLKSLLDKLLWCITCGCYRPEDDESSRSSGRELSPQESAAVQRLMYLLESEERSVPMTQDHHQCLMLLAKSKSESLHKLAAASYLVFAVDKSHTLEQWELEPLLSILRKGLVPAKLQATEAIFHMTHDASVENKHVFVSIGFVDVLVQLLQTPDVNLRILILATLTSLLTHPAAQESLHKEDQVQAVLKLVQASNKHVRLGALGVLLNYTRYDASSELLATPQVIDVLSHALAQPDVLGLSQTSAIICNLAITAPFRSLVVGQTKLTMLRQLVRHMAHNDVKVELNACSALRNLACLDGIQLALVQLDCLPVIKHILTQPSTHVLVTALSLLKNIALHRATEVKIVEESFLLQLERVLKMREVPEAQEMAAMVLQNVSSQNTIEKILATKCLETLIDVLINEDSTDDLLLAVAMTLGVLTDHVIARSTVLHYRGGEGFTRLINLAAKHGGMRIRESCAGIIAHISTVIIPAELLTDNLPQLLYYFQRALSSSSVELLHIALWTLPKFLVNDAFKKGFIERGLGEILEIQTDFGVTENIKGLAHLALQMTQ